MTPVVTTGGIAVVVVMGTIEEDNGAALVVTMPPPLDGVVTGRKDCISLWLPLGDFERNGNTGNSNLIVHVDVDIYSFYSSNYKFKINNLIITLKYYTIIVKKKYNI